MFVIVRIVLTIILAIVTSNLPTARISVACDPFLYLRHFISSIPFLIAYGSLPISSSILFLIAYGQMPFYNRRWFLEDFVFSSPGIFYKKREREEALGTSKRIKNSKAGRKHYTYNFGLYLGFSANFYEPFLQKPNDML